MPKSLTIWKLWVYSLYSDQSWHYVHTRNPSSSSLNGQRSGVHGLSLLTMRPSKQRDSSYRLDNNGWMLRLVQWSVQITRQFMPFFTIPNVTGLWAGPYSNYGIGGRWRWDIFYCKLWAEDLQRRQAAPSPRRWGLGKDGGVPPSMGVWGSWKNEILCPNRYIFTLWTSVYCFSYSTWNTHPVGLSPVTKVGD